MNSVPEPRKVTTPADFWGIVSDVQDAIARGLLAQIYNFTSSSEPYLRVQDLQEGGVVPDFVDMTFKAVQSSDVYNLQVETFHGAGGSWKRIGKE